MTPTLPTAPSPWKSSQPSAQVIQQHYVSARVHEINRTGSKLQEETIKLLAQDLAIRLKGYSADKKRAFLVDAYNHLTKVLQSRDLTINFKAASWFSQENPYDSYAQMYEKGIDHATGKMILDDSDINNPARTRVAADDRITFPAQWANAQQPGRRGLAPGLQSGQHIMSRMMAGDKLHTTPGAQANLIQKTKADGSAAYESPNPKFNPRAKQVFAALNYGRRPRGSNTHYGLSHMILNPSLKVESAYFADDTFLVPGADDQVTYQTLGAAYLKAKPGLRVSLITTCFDKICLADSDVVTDLLEAHIFAPVRFAGGVSRLVLEETRDQVIVDNVKKFCTKWGIKLVRF